MYSVRVGTICKTFKVIWYSIGALLFVADQVEALQRDTSLSLYFAGSATGVPAIVSFEEAFEE